VRETLITVPKERDMTENTTVYETATTFAPSAASQSKTMRYYDLKKNWRRVKPHLVDKKLNDVLVRDFNKFTTGRWGRPFVHGNLPSDFESATGVSIIKENSLPFGDTSSTPLAIGW
jgi:hypothetical protein